MRKQIITKESLSKFLGTEKISDMKELLIAMDLAADKIGTNNVNVFFPGVCGLDTIYGTSQYSASINIAKEKRINIEEILEKLVHLVQKEYDNQIDTYEKPVFVNFRFQKHAVQITNGHLEKDIKNQEMPMHAVLNYADKTFAKSLKTYRQEERKIGDNKVHQESISDLVRCRNLQNNNVAEGFIPQVTSWIKREKTKAEVGKALGFTVISKDSSGKINSKDDDRCLATRTCVHNKEIKEKDFATEVIETYNQMKKLRNNPSCIIGIEDQIEIHMDSRRIAITCSSNEKEKTFVAFLSKVLEFIGIENLDSANVQYKKDITVDDSFWTKVIGTVTDSIASVSEFIGRKKSIASIYLLMLLIEWSLFVAMALQANHSIFKTAILILPTALLFVKVIRNSEEKSLLMKVGRTETVTFTGLALSMSGIIYLSAGFNRYFGLLIGIAITLVILEILDKINPQKSESETWKKAVGWKDNIIHKLSSNTAVNIVFAALTIAIGITAFAISGIIILVVVFPASALVFIAIVADRRFWNDVEYEKERYNDQFFSNFKEERPGLTEDCEIRLKKTKCLKLWIWIPTKVFFRQLVEYGDNKYPKFLRSSSIKEGVTKLFKNQLSRFKKSGEVNKV